MVLLMTNGELAGLILGGLLILIIVVGGFFSWNESRQEEKFIRTCENSLYKWLINGEIAELMDPDRFKIRVVHNHSTEFDDIEVHFELIDRKFRRKHRFHAVHDQDGTLRYIPIPDDPENGRGGYYLRMLKTIQDNWKEMS